MPLSRTALALAWWKPLTARASSELPLYRRGRARGTVPMLHRRDALAAAAEWMVIENLYPTAGR